MRARRALATAVFALAATAASPPAFGQPVPPPPPNPAGLPVRTPDTSVTNAPGSSKADVDDDTANTSYWSRGRARAFTALAIDLGYIYFRPRVSFGYGRPFWSWVGVDMNPTATNRYLGAYGGLRAAIPNFDLRIGARYVWAFQQYYLKPASAYHRLDFENQDLSRSVYTTLEAEADGNVPVGPGSILLTASGSYMTGVPTDVYVYDEVLRVIIKPPWVWRGRLGYAVRLGQEGKVSLGIVADLLGTPGRNELVFRAGLVASATLSDHIQVLGSFVPPLIGADSIGVAGGDFAQLGIRYRWATGSPAPDAPPELPPP